MFNEILRHELTMHVKKPIQELTIASTLLSYLIGASLSEPHTGGS